MLLDAALRLTLVLAAAWALNGLLWRATAATRHLIWYAALLAGLLLPLAAVLPVPRVDVVPRALEWTAVGTPPPGTVEGEHAPAPPPVGPAPAAFPFPFRAAFQALAATGTVVIALWFAAGWLAAARLARRARPAPLAWQLELNTLCDRVRYPCRVRLAVLDQPGSPLATGLVRHAILLPPAAASWTTAERRAVLSHELAHITRRDGRVQLVAHAACALYWFHPLVWHAAAQVRRERERACDDEVLRLGAAASSYARHLLDIARELQPARRPSAALAMARPSELEGRLLAVLAVGRARVPARATRWLVLAIVTVITAVAAAASSSAEAQGDDAGALRGHTPTYSVLDAVMQGAEPAPSPRARAEATLQSSSDPQARERAALALALSSGRDVVPALLHALGDSDAQVREKAAIGLALRRDARVVQPLMTAMTDPDAQVREKVAMALGSSGDDRAREVLTRAVSDPDAQVREKAVAALLLLDRSR